MMECQNANKCDVKKIERVRQEDWTGVLGLLGIVEWRDGSQGTFSLNAPLTAYVEDGFLTEDDEKWYFFNAGHDLVKEVAKTELGDCWGIGCFAPNAESENLEADFYIFEKAAEGGKKEAVYVLANGEILVPPLRGKPDNKGWGYPAYLLVDDGPFEDWEYDYVTNPESTTLTEAKMDFTPYPDDNKPF
ncbi:MAG: hypothetical protein IJT50_12400 [Lentisphaeria bacterium]|nr:hypothetical protein [Lentisphaeria bacterium]